MLARRLALASAAVLAAAALVGTPPAQALTGTWSVQATPMPLTPNASPSGISCVSASWCMSVGANVGSNGVLHMLAQRWTGTSWRTIATPSTALGDRAELASVSCVSSSRCVAVGTETGFSALDPLAEVWDGTRWSWQVIPTRVGDTKLDAVSCWGRDGCLAVGSNSDKAFSEEWNGAAWTTRNTPSPTGARWSRLQGVSCVSVTRCIAVGASATGASGTGTALIEIWNGARWSIAVSPHPSGSRMSELAAVSCSSGSSCMAVGSQTAASGPHGLSESWNGVTWAVHTTPPSSAILSGVSCTSGLCEAVGTNFGSPRAARWNGHAWAAQSVASPGGGFANPLSAVSCVSATVCGAAGGHLIAGDAEVEPTYGTSLFETLTATRWIRSASSDPSGALQGELEHVSCGSSMSCVAIGGNGLITQTAFADAWDGSAWRLTTLAKPSGATSLALGGISCATATQCVAAGSWQGSSGRRPLVERWNGTGWTLATLPSFSTSAGLGAVSCVSLTSCVALGTSGATPFALVLKGTTWTRTPIPAGGSLAAVSCASATMCVGVGSVYATWDGSAWAARPLPNATRASLASVSCPSSSRCVAVGVDGTGAVSEIWDGSSWRVQPMATPADAAGIDPRGVSCSSNTFCLAVGGFCDQPVFGCIGGPSNDAPLTESWDGTSWTVLDTPAPSRASVHALADVSCVSSTSCTSVGWAQRWYEVPYALRLS